jgi:hypothetical protein
MQFLITELERWCSTPCRARLIICQPGSPPCLAQRRLEAGPRAQARFLVHESGKLDGKFVVWVDLDSTTMRALGQFLVELADRAEGQQR